jgi:hypothetical protein
VLEQNDKNWFSAYNITTDQTNGTWSLWVDSYLFLRGTTPDVLKDCVLILSGAATTAKTQLVPLVTAK